MEQGYVEIDREEHSKQSGERDVEDIGLLSRGVFQEGWLKALKTAGKMASEVFVYCLFIVGQMFFNSFCMFFLSKDNDVEGQASFSIATGLVFIFFVSMYWACLEKLGLDMAKQFGARDYAAIRKSRTQGTISVFVLFAVSTLPFVMYCRHIMQILRYSETNIERVVPLIKALLPSMVIELVASILRTICQAQGLEHYFGKLGSVNAVVNIGIAWFLIRYLKLGLFGYACSKTVFEVFNLVASLWVHTKIHEETKSHVGLIEASDQFLSYLWETVRFCLSNYIEVVGFEVSNYFVALTYNNAHITAFTSSLNLGSVVFRIGISVGTIFRTRLNNLLSKRLFTQAKDFFKLMYSLAVFLGFLSGLLVLLGNHQIASFYSSEMTEVKDMLKKILVIYAIFMPSTVSICTAKTTVKALKKINLLLPLYGLFYVVLNTAAGIWLFKLPTTRVIYLFLLLQFASLTINSLCLMFLLCSDWKKALE